MNTSIPGRSSGSSVGQSLVKYIKHHFGEIDAGHPAAFTSADRDRFYSVQDGSRNFAAIPGLREAVDG